jgi:hypothetical protein
MTRQRAIEYALEKGRSRVKYRQVVKGNGGIMLPNLRGGGLSRN